MSSNHNFRKIRYQNKNYGVFNVTFRDSNLPVVVDWKDCKSIMELNKRWRSNSKGFISSMFKHGLVKKEIFIQQIIMGLMNKDGVIKKQNKPIVHINRIGLDNRRCNLIYDMVNKNINKNIKKKRRTVNLPKNCGIDVKELPTYVWYMKPNGSHGARFMVDINDIKWKTTSSKKYSLRYKLEEAKRFLRELKQDKPELFDDYCMNGDYTKNGRELMNSFYTIIHKADFEHIERYIPESQTDNYIKEGSFTGLTDEERRLLQSNEPLFQNKRRRTICRLPENCGIKPSEIPKYCYYRPVYRNRGDYFIVEKHPKQEKRVWQTTSSKKIPIKYKFKQLLNYLKSLD